MDMTRVATRQEYLGHRGQDTLENFIYDLHAHGLITLPVGVTTSSWVYIYNRARTHTLLRCLKLYGMSLSKL